MNQAFPKKKWLLIIIVGLLFSAIAVWVIFNHPKEKPSDPQSTSQQEQSVLSVQVISPIWQTWDNKISASGQIAAWQEMIISPEISGYRISQLYVDVGDQVKKGKLLVRLADESLKAELRKQQASVTQNQVSLQQAESNLKRAKIIGSGGALSDQQLEEYRINVASAQASVASAQAELDSIKLRLSQTHIYALDNGVVSSKSGVLGNVVSSGTELYRLIRQGRLEWRAEVDAKQIGYIKVGQKVSLSVTNGTALQGTVRTVGAALSTDTGRNMVYVNLEKSTAHVGMFADGQISVGSRPARTIPQSALVMRDGRAYVYVVGQNEKVKSVAVETGRRVSNDVEVLSELAMDARVVQKGGAFLSEDVKVTILPNTLKSEMPINSELTSSVVRAGANE